MADIRCPMCGKPNPAERDTCQFCQARLKPLTSPPPPQENKPERAHTGLTDWLTDLRSGDDNGAFESSPDKDSFASESSDWLDRLAAEPEPAPKPAKPDWLAAPSSGGDPHIPDWMEDLGVKSPPPPAVSNDTSDEPDWLQRIRARHASEEPPASAQANWDSAAPAEDSAPDWLSQLASAAAPAAPEAASPAGDDAFDWMRPAPEKPPAAKTEAFPEWMNSFGAAGAAPANEPPAAGDDWLKDLGGQPVGAFTETGVDDEPAAPPPAKKAESAPDWLSNLGGNPPPASPGGIPAFIMDDEDAVELGDADEPPSLAQTADLETLPDWLAQVRPEEAARPAPPQGEAESDLTPAQLPSWLEAMRPVEAAAPSAPYKDETDTHIESAGPLAGLRGALPAEVEIARFHKPPVYGNKLTLSDDQQARVNVLEQLIAAEGEPKAIPARPAVTSQVFVRLGIALALFAAVIYSLWAGENQIPLPAAADISSEVFNVHQRINELAPSQPVLVVFAYDAAYAAEMSAAAGAVLTDTVNRGAFLTLVSTLPGGPLVAEASIRQYLPPATEDEPARYANLGYLPGGGAGVQAFAANPRKTLPVAINGEAVWASETLTTVQTIADFALIIILSEDAESAQTWIEQTTVALENSQTPLLVIASAQAAPLIRPYAQNQGQVDGLLGGLEGGAAYESLRAASGPARRLWDSFSATLLVAGLVIVAGAVVSVLAGLSAGRKPSKGEAQQ